MMEFFQQLPHLEPYGNPQYFVYVIAATLPIFMACCRVIGIVAAEDWVPKAVA